MLWEFRLPLDLETLSFITWAGMTILDIMDFVSNSVMMPIVAFFTCVFVGFFVKPKTIADEVKVTDGRFVGEKLFTVMIKWITPVISGTDPAQFRGKCHGLVQAVGGRETASGKKSAFQSIFRLTARKTCAKFNTCMKKKVEYPLSP